MEVLPSTPLWPAFCVLASCSRYVLASAGWSPFTLLIFFSVIKFLGRLLLIFPFCGRTYKQTYGRTDTETDFSMSTPSSSPNKAGLIVCPSVHRFVHPSTKINSDLNEILYTGQVEVDERYTMVCCMTRSKVKITEVSKLRK